MNTEYEKFLLSRNPWDVPMLQTNGNETDVLYAAVRRHVCVLGAYKTAREIYALADMLAVRSVEHDRFDAPAVRPAPAPPVIAQPQTVEIRIQRVEPTRAEKIKTALKPVMWFMFGAWCGLGAAAWLLERGANG